MSHRHNKSFLTLIFLLSVFYCNGTGPQLPELTVLPENYVYTIVRHNDSLYYTTPAGQIYRFHIAHPEQREQVGLQRFLPIRSLVFTGNGNLYAASYQTGVHLVKNDTLLPCRSMLRRAWSMKKDGNDKLWLAGPRGVFRQINDTLVRFSSLREANDIAFFRGGIAVAHRNGVSLFHRASEKEDTTYCRGTICWVADSYDSLLVCGGVECCEIITGTSARSVKLPIPHDIPWRSTCSENGTIYLACQKGLMRILPDSPNAECIAFRDSCIKSVHFDESNRLWVGRYFKSAEHIE